jgi:uroporphyrin-III C-methyltransferase/precorrin-2 dehydrogenase/sirohydrochlorin ferrochelatase
MADAVLHDPGIAAAILDRSRADALRRPLPQDPDRFDGIVAILKRG